MADPLRHHIDWHAGSERCGGVGVGQPVDADLESPCGAGMAEEPFGQPLGVDRPAVVSAEHEIAVFPGRPGDEPLGQLPFAMLTRHADRRRVECDGALGGIGLPVVGPHRLRVGQR